MKTIEEKAKECIDNLIDSLSLEVNHEESNYDAGQVHALSNYGKEIYKIGFSEGQSNPKIKQLKWEERKYSFAARTAFGFYKILDASIFKKRQSCTLYFGETAQKVLTGTYDECIKYAQLDYEEKVRKCLITE